jgi:hypothetical protein
MNSRSRRIFAIAISAGVFRSADAYGLGPPGPVPSSEARPLIGTDLVVPKRIVRIRVTGEPRDAGPLLDSIRELLGRMGVGVRSEGADGEPAPIGWDETLLARVEIDLTAAGGPTVVVSRGAAGEPLLKRTIPSDAPGLIAREELAHVVQAAVGAALLDDEDGSKAPASPAAPAPPDAGPTEPPTIDRPPAAAPPMNRAPST